MADKPNIVLIVADDMGYGDFGLYSEGRVHTPALDQLAVQSLRLTQHYAGSAVCSPSRAALLTGRYPHRTGAITPQETLGYDRIALDEVTIADSFKAAGYATGLVGKWHNGALNPAYHPIQRGFDEFVGFRSGWMDYYDWWLDRNGAIEAGDGRYLTDVLTEEATGFIKRHSATPFFLMIAYNAPHSPLQAPEDVVQKYESEGFSRGVALTYAMIEVMDRGIASIRQALRDTGQEGNTVFMFTSDNGPAFILRDDQVPEDVSIDTTRFNLGMNGAKGTVYEGGIRVPMLLSWPDGLPQTVICPTLSTSPIGCRRLPKQQVYSKPVRSLWTGGALCQRCAATAQAESRHSGNGTATARFGRPTLRYARATGSWYDLRSTSLSPATRTPSLPESTWSWISSTNTNRRTSPKLLSGPNRYGECHRRSLSHSFSTSLTTPERKTTSQRSIRNAQGQCETGWIPGSRMSKQSDRRSLPRTGTHRRSLPGSPSESSPCVPRPASQLED